MKCCPPGSKEHEQTLSSYVSAQSPYCDTLCSIRPMLGCWLRAAGCAREARVMAEHHQATMENQCNTLRDSCELLRGKGTMLIG